MQVESLPIKSIHPNPDHPRRTFKQESLEELAASFKAYGQLQPITVRRNGHGYIIIAGERRWRAAQLAGWPKLAAIVRDDLDEREAYELSLMENVMREAMDPIDEVRAFAKLLEQGLTDEEICERYGWGKGTVTWKMSVLKCREDIQHLVKVGALGITQGVQLGRLSPNGQGRAVRALMTEKLGPIEFTAVVNSIWTTENAVEMFPPEDTQLTPEARRAGRKVEDFLKLAASAAGQIHDVDDAAIAHGLTGVVGAEEKVENLIAVLRRISNSLRRHRAKLLAKSLETQDTLDLVGPAT